MQNYVDVINDPSIWNYFLASATVALGSTCIVLVIGIPTANVLARYRFRGNADFGFWILTTRMTPPVAVLIPFFVMYVRVGLLDTNLGLIIAHVAMNLSIVVWLMKGFFEDLPPEFEEAAFMDGASYFQAFYRICLPAAIAINASARFSHLRPGGLRHSLPLHKEVYGSILAHRPDVARAHMRALIDDAQEDMRMVLERCKAEGPDQKVAKEQH